MGFVLTVLGALSVPFVIIGIICLMIKLAEKSARDAKEGQSDQD